MEGKRLPRASWDKAGFGGAFPTCFSRVLGKVLGLMLKLFLLVFTLSSARVFPFIFATLFRFHVASNSCFFGLRAKGRPC